MKFTLFALTTAIASAVPLLAQAPDRKPTIQIGPSVNSKISSKDVSAAEAAKLIADNPGLIVLDVRTEEEFEHEHIKGAVNVNAMDKGFEIRVAALDQTKPVLVHCQAGSRSFSALKRMAGNVRFPQVYHLKEGFIGWKKANQPFERTPLPGIGRLGPATKPGTEKPDAPKPDAPKPEGPK